MIRFAQTMQSNLQGVGKLIEVRVPLSIINFQQKLIIDHIEYQQPVKEIVIYAQVVDCPRIPIEDYTRTVPYRYRELK